MGTVYVAVYLAAAVDDLTEPVTATAITQAFMQAVGEEWPFDVGDDPSFFCARAFGAPITWGICRRDLRNLLEPDDVVVFIAHRKRPGGVIDYLWSGFATVAEKVSQADIWEEERLGVFRRYLNLLIRPDGQGGYRHVEIAPGRPHADWLWRLTRSKGHSWRRKDFASYSDSKCSMRFVPGRDRAAGETVVMGSNYVVFSSSPEYTVVLPDPPLVARYRSDWGPQRPERWFDSAVAVGLRRLTLDFVAGRSLRITTQNRARTRIQQRHRHIRVPVRACSSDSWREEVRKLLPNRQGIELGSSVDELGVRE